VKKVDSDALGVANQALGLTGSGADVTEFLDGELGQTLDVAPIIRRGRTQAATQGIYQGYLRNEHAGAGSLATTEAVYAVDVGVLAPYPDPVPAQFDIWLMAAFLRQESGTGTIEATLTAVYPAVTRGWGLDDSGLAVTDSPMETVLAFWDTIVTVGVSFGLQGTQGPMAHIGMRLPRSDTMLLRFRSTASALATFGCQVMLGIFPVALGQDIIT